ncbi:unnamed protein product [Rotaria sp. Silwood2]|nr:unnamed protein product [Rotaria sp. Silwood2]CAF3014582.1 unnamed protein product [Rotaria sp. Silwood2]CAF3510136.1 unnamed protein product [Rotaria sp. Silwood2]CAF4084883.1 unnamed protein product [Rotaria sp. Silwood2]CAF4206592.1 unnamed protein product [Rotaria sp. Silwood2]
MGNTIDSEVKQEENILERPQKGNASEFYWACRNGDIERVKQLLLTIPYNDLNRLEPNGSTQLHAATYLGHTEIVRLLLQHHGVRRHRRNRHGHTAYEEAQTDDMRQIFHRPSNKNRFCDNENVQETFQVVKSEDQELYTESDDNVNYTDSPWINNVGTEDELHRLKRLSYAGSGRAILKSSLFMFLTKKFIFNYESILKEAWPADMIQLTKLLCDRAYRVKEIQKTIEKFVTPSHSEYNKCCTLLSKYEQTGILEHLLKLYTLETPFYRQLKEDYIDSLLSAIAMDDSQLKKRYYKGQVYRGVLMTKQDVNNYRWALKTIGSLILTTTFSSTSLHRDVAENFTSLEGTSDKIRVLTICDFPTVCQKAINLNAIPNHQLSCISEYENEAGVLILPGTPFRVKNVEGDEQFTTILLENVCIESYSLYDTTKSLFKEYGLFKTD